MFHGKDLHHTLHQLLKSMQLCLELKNLIIVTDCHMILLRLVLGIWLKITKHSLFII